MNMDSSLKIMSMKMNERLNYWGLVKLCIEYKEDIKARKNLSAVLVGRKVRYVDQQGHFGYTQFGDFYFTSMGVMMLITTDRNLTWYHSPDEMSRTLYSTVPVFFAGIEIGLKDDLGRGIYTGDVVKLSSDHRGRNYTLMVSHISGDDLPGLEADYRYIYFQDSDSLLIVGNVFHDILAEHLDIYDLEYYTGYNSILRSCHDEDVVNAELERMAKAPYFKNKPKKVERRDLCYDEFIGGFEARPEDTMILFCSDSEDCIAPEDGSFFAEAYFDYVPSDLQRFNSFSIPINLSNPDFEEIKKDVDDILLRAHSCADETFVVLDYKKSIQKKTNRYEEIATALDEMFWPVAKYSLHNVVLPFRALNETIWNM